PVLAGPVLGDADPARAVLVLLALTVPEELHLHPAVLVGVDLLALGPDHHRRLRPLHDGPRRQPGRPERRRRRHAAERVAVGRLPGPALDGRVRRAMLDRGEDVALILGLALVPRQRELAARRERGALAGPADPVVGR